LSKSRSLLPVIAGQTTPPRTCRLRKTLLITVEHDRREQQLLAGCQVLNDGNILWFGRTDAEDRAYVEHIRDDLWLAGLSPHSSCCCRFGGSSGMCCGRCRT
jgi:hypothetical protein